MIDVGLTSQIVKLYNERLLPSRESTERRRKFVDKLEGIIKSEWPDHDIQLHLFGSSANGLATTQSDVDICLTTTWKQLEDLSLLSAVLRKSGMRSIHTVPRAKVPLVKFVDPEYRLSCDINVNNPLAIENTRMIRTFVEIDERVRPLAMIVKFWSKRRDLSDAAFGGTFAPYTWLNLLLNFLQMRDPPVLPILHQYRSPLDHGMIPVYLDAWFNDDIEALRGYGKSNTESLGRLLYEFFKTYGVSFDHMTKVVSLRNGCWLDKSDKGWNVGRSAAQVCVEEPFDTTRNLGNSADSESVLGIIGELERAYLVLHETGNLNTVCDKYVDSSLGVYSDIDMIANGPALTLRRGSGGARRASASPNGHVPPRIQTNGASHPGTNGRITGQKVNLSRSVGHLTPPHGRSINAAMMSRSPPGWVGTTAITQQNEQQATPVPTTVPTVQSPHPSKPIGYGSASDVIKQPPRLTDIQNELDRASGSSSNGRRSQNRHSRRSSGKRHSRTSSNSNR
ncbi:hypothetical protein GQ42DRAFT_145682 [Ramicandelaber brevisporus]|nr:hypothetical protein GQ42DRAFT_145682 [Ramicandelaber brevisporus]